MQYRLLMMVLAEYSSSYSLFACHMMLATIYFDLAQTQQHFQTIVQLAQAFPHNVMYSLSKLEKVCVNCSVGRLGYCSSCGDYLIEAQQ